MNHNKDDSEPSIDNILFEERLDQDPVFEGPEEFEAAHVQPLKDKLLHFSRFGNLLTLILGETGTGKTYLLEQFVDCMDENVFVCHIKAQPLFTEAQLYEQICTSIATEEIIEFPYDADSFRTWLDEIGLQTESHVVAIDDAESLSQDVLLEICRLSAYQQTLDIPQIQFMLFASHDLAISMDNISPEILDDSGIYVIDVPLLEESDARGWLKYCLHKAGYLASEVELDDLLVDSDGNLANLAMFAESYASEQLEDEDSDIDEEPEESVSIMGFWFAGLTIIVIGILGVFFYQKEITGWLFPGAEPARVVETAPVVVSEPKPELAATVDEVQEQEVSQPAEDDIQKVTSLVSEPEQEQITEAKDTGKSGMVPETDANELAQSAPQELTQPETELLEQKVITSPDAQAETNVATLPDTSGPIYTSMEQKLMATDDSQYVIQIIGLTNSNSVAKVLAENSRLGLVSYRSMLNGKPWQVIVLPGFTNYQDAQQARKDLPASLAEFEPWIKPQSKVKEEIQAAVSN